MRLLTESSAMRSWEGIYDNDAREWSEWVCQDPLPTITVLVYTKLLSLLPPFISIPCHFLIATPIDLVST